MRWKIFNLDISPSCKRRELTRLVPFSNMELDSGPDPGFIEGSQKFVNWFRALPGATFHKDITIEDLRERNAGRGIGNETTTTAPDFAANCHT